MDSGNLQISLRPAERKDCRLIYEWRNHPAVRRFFFQSQEISFAEHEHWFSESLARPGRMILIAHRQGNPFGVIRFDLDADGRTAEVDIYIDPEKQGQGLGSRLLEAGSRWVAEHTRVQTLKARVMAENKASLRLFQHGGFQKDFIQFHKELKREAP